MSPQPQPCVAVCSCAVSVVPAPCLPGCGWSSIRAVTAEDSDAVHERANALSCVLQETRYRRRYLDAIVNSSVRDIFQTRAAIIRYIRRFFDDRGFLEVPPCQKMKELPPCTPSVCWFPLYSQHLRHTDCTLYNVCCIYSQAGCTWVGLGAFESRSGEPIVLHAWECLCVGGDSHDEHDSGRRHCQALHHASPRPGHAALHAGGSRAVPEDAGTPAAEAAQSVNETYHICGSRSCTWRVPAPPGVGCLTDAQSVCGLQDTCAHFMVTCRWWEAWTGCMRWVSSSGTRAST